MAVKTPKDIYESGFDNLLKRPGIDNEGFDAQRLNASDKAYIKKLLQSVITFGVNSVNNLTGDVTLTTDNISEGSNLYFTAERAMDAVLSVVADSASIDVTYNDLSDTFTIDLKTSFTDAIYARLDMASAFTGVVKAKAGNSASNVNMGGILQVDTTTTGNVTTGEDDLITFTIPANTLQNNGDFIEFEMAGFIAATANNKRVRVYLDNTALFDTTALVTTTAEDWSIKGKIIKTGTGTQKCIVEWISTEATLLTSVDYSTSAEDETAALVLKATGEATATDDIVQELLIVRWQPSA